MIARVLGPGEIEAPAGEIPYVRLPERSTVFADRARRLRQLAEGHRLSDWLKFVARLSDAQQTALERAPDVPLPDAALLARAKEHAMPPLPARGGQRHPAWRTLLDDLLAQLAGQELPETSRAAVAALAMSDAASREAQADALLDGRFEAADAASAPFIAAALQIHWVDLATRLGPSAFGRAEPANLCPVCGSAPVASRIVSGPQQGLRYLHCSLCATEWHMVRAKCSNCEASGKLSYYSIEGEPGIAKAEACGDCNSYLKIFYADRDPAVEPVADDLASLALDLLMADTGLYRSGPNLLLVSS